MKKAILLLGALLLCFSFVAKGEEVTYHFQEGFATTAAPAGWTKTCEVTTSLVHTTEPAYSFAGAAAMKFATKCIDETFYLETPEVSGGAGTLSFYITKNANNTLMDFYILKIVNGVATQIKTIDAFTVSNKTVGWDKISIVVNEEANVKFKFYSTIRANNAGWFVIDDIELTKMSAVVVPPAGVVEKINTNFGDGTWGEILASAPASGSYPSSEVNGFKLDKAVLLTGSLGCAIGETHTNRVLVDKSSTGANLEFPTLKTVGEVEIHATTGSADMSFRLEELVNSNWVVIGTYTTRPKIDSIYVIPVPRTEETKLRIANNTGSGLYLYKIATRTYQESQELNITSSTPSEGSVCYYNLTKEIVLNFNKEVDFGTGNISLNDVLIPVENCIITGKSVRVPVTLESTITGKNYGLTIPQGAFVEKGNASNVNNAKVVSFQTLKTVSYPVNYSSQLDVVYSAADASMNRMDIYYPTTVLKSSKPVPVVINIHGGGWSSGDKESQGGFSTYFNMGMAVANVEYRMTPQATAPAAVVDVRCAMKYLLAHADELNIDVNKIIFQGGSAGGHLALTAGYLQNDEKFDIGASDYTGSYKVVAIIDKYGPADLPSFVYSPLDNWLGQYKDDADFVRSISPLSMVDASTPPTYIIHGNADPTVPYSQSVTLANALEAAGVKYQFTTVPDGVHGSFTAEWNATMYSEITTFLTEVLSKATVGVENNPQAVENAVNLTLENGVLIAKVADNATIEIYDSLGKKVITSNEKRIDLSALPSGVLVVTVKTENNFYTQKVLK